jgi:8-oxo-dGTP pyrophosphatase MutT (NUDIX family)
MKSVFKYCPKCKEHLHIVSDKYMECMACDFEYYINSVASVAAIILDNNGDLLLIRRSHEPGKGKLTLPGGFIDPGESPTDALIREVGEELNFMISSASLFTAFPNQYAYKGIIYYTTDLIYECSVKVISPVELSEESSEVLYVNPLKIDYEKIAFGSIKNAILEYVKKKIIK